MLPEDVGAAKSVPLIRSWLPQNKVIAKKKVF